MFGLNSGVMVSEKNAHVFLQLSFAELFLISITNSNENLTGDEDLKCYL